MPSPKSQAVGEELDHFITHTLSCTLESEDVSVMSYGGLKFGSLNEVIKVDDLVCLDDRKEVPKKAARVFEQRRHD